jgi:hypothetical protein
MRKSAKNSTTKGENIMSSTPGRKCAGGATKIGGYRNGAKWGRAGAGRQKSTFQSSQQRKYLKTKSK